MFRFPANYSHDCNMAKRVYRFACLAALAFWMGGFTFYALIVIPTGNRLLGSLQQGLLTQQVTQWMNLSGVLTLAILSPGARRSKLLAASWLVMATSLAMLFWLHPRLDALIDASIPAVSDESFYHWHQAYLVAVTIQWSAALVCLWGLTTDGSRGKSNSQGPATDGSVGP
jgi:hypothetical protein